LGIATTLISDSHQTAGRADLKITPKNVNIQMLFSFSAYRQGLPLSVCDSYKFATSFLVITVLSFVNIS